MDQTARRLFEVPTLSARNKWKEKWGWEEGVQQRCTNKLLIHICPVLFTVNEMLRKYTNTTLSLKC